MSEEHANAVLKMRQHLDIISDTMRHPADGEEPKILVRDLLAECQSQRKRMEEIAMAYIDGPGGDVLFNEITAPIDRLEELEKQAAVWEHQGPAATPMGGDVPAPAMRGMSSSASQGSGPGAPGSGADDFGFDASRGQSYSEGGFDDRAMRMNSDAPSDGSRRRDKKQKKERKQRSLAGETIGEEFGAPPAEPDFGFGTPAADASAHGGFGEGIGGGDPGGFAWPEQEASGSGWDADGPAAGGWGASAGADRAAPFGTTGTGGGVGGGAFDGTGSAGFDPSGWGGGQSAFPAASAARFDAPADDRVEARRSHHEAIDSGWGANTGPDVSPYHSEPKASRLKIAKPFAEVADDINGFKMRFIHSVAEATGVAPHRIKVHSVRPGYGG